jgi:DNA-binding beta-propeller fold protein YncE
MKGVVVSRAVLALALAAALGTVSCSNSSSNPGCGTCTAPSILFASAPALLAAYAVQTGGGLGTPAEFGSGSVTSFQLAVSRSAGLLYQPDIFSHAVLAYTINNSTGALTAVSGSPFSMGSNSQGAYGIAMTPSSQYLYVSDVNGSIVGFSINASTGGLTQLPSSPLATGVYPRALAMAPSGNVLYATDPFSSTVMAFTIHAQDGSLSPVAGSPFALLPNAGPGGLAVEPSGHSLYVSLTNLGKISVLTIDPATGAVSELPASPFGAGKKVQQLAITPNHFLYALNASDNTISGYSINPGDGSLAAVSGSPFPTGVLPSLLYTAPFPGSVASDREGSVLWVGAPWNTALATFGIDASSGALTFQRVTNLPATTPPGQVSVAFYQP